MICLPTVLVATLTLALLVTIVAPELCGRRVVVLAMYGRLGAFTVSLAGAVSPALVLLAQGYGVEYLSTGLPFGLEVAGSAGVTFVVTLATLKSRYASKLIDRVELLIISALSSARALQVGATIAATSLIALAAAEFSGPVAEAIQAVLVTLVMQLNLNVMLPAGYTVASIVIVVTAGAALVRLDHEPSATTS